MELTKCDIGACSKGRMGTGNFGVMLAADGSGKRETPTEKGKNDNVARNTE